MHVVNPVCCGIDVHSAVLVACLRQVSPEGHLSLEHRECGTTYSELLALGDWLVAADCPIVAMESTGVYWKPVYHVLCGLVEVLVGNPQEIRQRPGKKTDKADATWIAELLAHGLIQPSFIPPPAIRALRDVTRTRVALVQSRTQAKSHIPPDLVVKGITAHRKPPEVRICRLRNQSGVGNRPPSTSTPHCPACLARR
jgi:transposase